MSELLTYNPADFELPARARIGHCPKCGEQLRDTGVSIKRPDGQVRRVMECTQRMLVDVSNVITGYSHYEGTAPA